MNKNLDLRIQKTYTCLMNAMLELIKEKTFDQITVNELCERALVGRGTFYKHFSDKNEFFIFILNEMLEHYLLEAEEKTDPENPCYYYIAFFEAFMLFIEKINQVFGPPTSNSTVSVMIYSMSETISQKLERHFRMDEDNGNALIISPVSAARFLTGAMAQSARYRMSHPDQKQEDGLVEDMQAAIKMLYKNPTLCEQ